MGISRPGEYEDHREAYNAQERKQALKYQDVTTLDWLILHAYGPMEEIRDDWNYYMRSSIYETLLELIVIEGTQYLNYGYSGYNQRPFMEVTFQGSNMAGERCEFNEAMSTVSVTVEWIVKLIKL